MNYNKLQWQRKIEESVMKRDTKYNGMIYQPGGKVYIQKLTEKKWSGPAKVA